MTVTAAVSLEDSPIQAVHESGTGLVDLDWSRETRFEKYGAFLAENGIASTCTLPLTRGPRHLGRAELGQAIP